MNTSSLPGWHGHLDLCFARSTSANSEQTPTRLIRSYACAPLKIQRPFYPEPEVCQTVLLHTAGGMVGGDRLSYRLQLEPAAQALVTTAAATKIYRSNGRAACQTVAVEIGENACLEWLPQETIVFDRAIYQQAMRVHLAAGAIWCGWEITRLGRSASGEQFVQGQWRNAIEVWQGGQPLWIDRQQIVGSPAHCQSLHGLAGQPIVGTLAIVGIANILPETIDRARALWPGAERGLVYGVSKIRGGIVCRYRGGDRQAVQQWFIAVWHLVRQQYCHRSACVPRVWQL
jgi:urease accessory protein